MRNRSLHVVFSRSRHVGGLATWFNSAAFQNLRDRENCVSRRSGKPDMRGNNYSRTDEGARWRWEGGGGIVLVCEDTCVAHGNLDGVGPFGSVSRAGGKRAFREADESREPVPPAARIRAVNHSGTLLPRAREGEVNFCGAPVSRRFSAFIRRG